MTANPESNPNPVLDSRTRAKKYLQRFAAENPVVFGAVMTLAALLIKVPFTPLVLFLPMTNSTEVLVDLGIGVVLLTFLFLPIETLTGQVLPIWALRKFRIERWRTLIAGSALWFGLLHVLIGPGGIVLGFAGGLVFALCWLSWEAVSTKRAFVGTTLVHGAHNGAAFLLYLSLPK